MEIGNTEVAVCKRTRIFADIISEDPYESVSPNQK
jgi:hypothetical protein